MFWVVRKGVRQSWVPLHFIFKKIKNTLLIMFLWNVTQYFWNVWFPQAERSLSAMLSGPPLAQSASCLFFPAETDGLPGLWQAPVHEWWPKFSFVGHKLCRQGLNRQEIEGFPFAAIAWDSYSQRPTLQSIPRSKQQEISMLAAKQSGSLIL